jgi:hypothetical protein
MAWLEEVKGKGAVVTQLPDAAEVDLSMGAWELWFEAAADRCFEASTGPTVFVQTDRRFEGRLISKPALINRASRQDLLWHRILLRRDVGSTDLRRPTFSHVLAYGPGKPGAAQPDVWPIGKPLWPNGLSVQAALRICSWLKSQGVTAVTNPFSGQGTILAAANAQGLDAYGCELDNDRANACRRASLEDKA